MRNIVESYLSEHIINIDETSFQFLKNQNHSYARVGADHVNGFSDTDCKFAFTAIGGVIMRGDKLPLLLLTFGSTAVCHRQFGPYTNNNECVVEHSLSGWMNETIMIKYLNWLSVQFNQMPLAFLVDCYGSHETEAVLDEAVRLDIEIAVIPAGGTGLFQSLDIAVFGVVVYVWV